MLYIISCKLNNVHINSVDSSILINALCPHYYIICACVKSIFNICYYYSLNFNKYSVNYHT